jgi:two-component sensor histidine kinase
MARFSERIRALLANQDLLVRNEWKGVEIRRSRTRALRRPHWLSYRRAGPQAALTGAFAQAVGLALHELAANAGKYGALSTDAGRVHICWRTDGDPSA